MTRRPKPAQPAPPPPDRPGQKRLRAICCEILHREMCLVTATCPNVVDLDFLPKGLHDAGPEEMGRVIQEHIDAVDPAVYDGACLGFGLCSNGTVGLRARTVPVVVPRAHDCVTLFFGSKEVYRSYFDRHPGTYFRTTGWSERDFCWQRTSIPSQLGMDKDFNDYVRQYGTENAEFIMQMLTSWERHYNRMAYIDTGIASFLPHAEEAEREAIARGWAFERLAGDLSLIEALVGGPWLDDEFLVLQPGQELIAANDGAIIAARDVQA